MLLQNLYWILHDQHITSLTVTRITAMTGAGREPDSNSEFRRAETNWFSEKTGRHHRQSGGNRKESK